MQRKICLLGLLYSVLLVPLCSSAAESVQIISETSRSISFSVNIPEPVFAPAGNDEGVVCSIEGFGIFNESRMPSVVIRGIMAAIPPEAQVEMHISVHSIQKFENIDLAPVPTVEPDASTIDSQAAIQYIRDTRVYSSDEYFPAQHAEIAYTGYLRGMHFAQLFITPVQYNPVQGVVRVARSMTVTLFFDDVFGGVAGVQHMAPDHLSVPGEKAFGMTRNDLIINQGSTLMDMRLSQAGTIATAALSGELQNSPFAIKIITSGAGIYRVRYEDIAPLGLDLSELTNSNIKIENSGQEIAVYRSGKGQFQTGDYILFYAEDFQSDYSSTNVYWLYQGSASGLVMQTRNGAPVNGFPQPESFVETVHFEQNLVWKRNLPDYTGGEDQWFWELLYNFNVDEFNIDFSLDDFNSDAGGFSMEVSLRGRTDGDHYTKFFLNGIEIGAFEWTGAVRKKINLSSVDPVLFNTGANTLNVTVLTAPDHDPTASDQYYLNWASLTYARHYVADNDRLVFSSDISGDTRFEVTGFSDPSIMVFDVGRPKDPVIITGPVISTDNATSQVLFEYTADNATLLYAATRDACLAPEALIVDTPSALMSSRADIDYIIITHTQLLSTVEALKTIREQSGLAVEIVDVQDIYDEFSYGIKDVTAIKDFLRHAYFNWHASDHPTYVVLVGDATYDYRDNLGLAASGKADLVPTYLGYRGTLGSDVGATASDNWYVCVDGDDPLPDMVIGRLCVKNEPDLQNIIAKIESYENAGPDDWRSRVVFAVDEDNENLFEEAAEAMAGRMSPGYSNINLYLSQYGTDITTATDDLVAAISNGALITNYIGHGSPDTWSSGWFRTPNENTGQTRDDVLRLTNMDQYTFLMILNCLSGAFSEVNDDYCMAEEFVRQQDRGAVISMAPSASGYLSQQKELGKKIYDYLFDDNLTVGGSLVTAAKIAAYQQTAARDLLETFIFFGDPALELKMVPQCESDGDCPEGVCFDNICVECAHDNDCDSGVCRSNKCVIGGSVQIDTCKVKAGKNSKGDKIKFSGLLDVHETDFIAAIGSNVIVTIEAYDIPDLDATTFLFPIEEDNLKKGKYKAKIKPVDKSDPTTSFKVNTSKGKFKFSAKNADLTGLSCPITITIQIGDYVAEKVLEEDIVNGPRKSCPADLMESI